MCCLKRALLVVSLLLPALAARATLVTWEFAGTVTTVGAADAGALGSLGVFVGTPLVGRLVYDASVPSSAYPGLYFAVHELSFSAGAYSITLTRYSASTGFAAIAGTDELGVNLTSHQAPSLADPSLWLDLSGTDPVNGDSLPIEPPLGSETQVLFRVYGRLGGDPALTSSDLTITRAVPEAARPVLLGVAGTGLVLLRARRRGRGFRVPG